MKGKSMSTVSIFQISKGLYRYRKPLAILVIVESIVSHRMKHNKKSARKSMDDTMSQMGDKASDFMKHAEEYIKDVRKRMKH